jgi:hypothetical protein
VGKGRVIHYCIEASPDFGVSVEAARKKIEEAFATWDRYQELKLTDRTPETLPSTRIKFEPNCAPNIDIAFFLGVNNSRTIQAAEAYQDPLAFEYRATRAPEKQWSQGYIWVKKSPNWANVDNLFAVLLHEIGHIQGNAHVAGTIMDTNIAHFLCKQDEYLVDNRSWYDQKKSLTEIDQQHELVVSQSGSASFHGIVSQLENDLIVSPLLVTDLPSSVKYGEETFELMTGRKPSGPMYVDWSIRSFSDSFWLTGAGSSKLTLSDSQGTTDLNIQIIPSASLDSGRGESPYPKAFYVLSTDKSHMDQFEEGGGVKILIGQITAQSGTVYPVVIARNSTFPSPVRIVYLDGTGVANELMMTRFTNDLDWRPYFSQ